MNITPEDWLLSTTQRPEYVDRRPEGYPTRFRHIWVCPEQAARMSDKAWEMRANPPKFDIVGMNCSSGAASVLGAGGVGNGIVGLDTPDNFWDQFTFEGSTAFGYTQIHAVDRTFTAEINGVSHEIAANPGGGSLR